MTPLALALALASLSTAAQPPRVDCAAWMDKDRNAPESAAPDFKGYRRPEAFPADVRRVFDVLTAMSGLADTHLDYLTKAGLPADANLFERTACGAGAAVDDGDRTFYVCDSLAGIVEDSADLVFVMAHELAHMQRGDASASAKVGREALAEWNPSRGDVNDYVCGRVLESMRGFEREADRMATEFVIGNRAELERRLEISNLRPDVGVSVVFKRKEFYFRRGIGEDKRHDTAEQRAHLIEQTVTDRLNKALNAVPDGF